MTKNYYFVRYSCSWRKHPNTPFGDTLSAQVQMTEVDGKYVCNWDEPGRWENIDGNGMKRPYVFGSKGEGERWMVKTIRCIEKSYGVKMVKE